MVSLYRLAGELWTMSISSSDATKAFLDVCIDMYAWVHAKLCTSRVAWEGLIVNTGTVNWNLPRAIPDVYAKHAGV